MKNKYLLLLILCFFSTILNAQIDPVLPDKSNITYAEVNGKQLLLDVYLPHRVTNAYLIVWIHGGAWNSGSKQNPPVNIVDSGYALASINYRLSGEAPFPAQVYDIKAAIRFLRAHAKEYGYRSDRIIIWGSSAGAHLATLVGTTNNDKSLEGDLGNYRNESSAVQAIMDFYGPTNFLTILNQSTPHGLDVRVPALTALLGKPVEQATDLAKQASPVFQVDPTDPPLLIVHGDQDNQVPINQSIELMEAYKKAGLSVQLEFVAGAGHGGAIYNQEHVMNIVKNFLEKEVKN